MANRTKGRPPANKSVAPATDKVFGEKARKAKGKRPKGPAITIDTYNAMYDAYMAVQTAAHVAKTCKVDRRTARRYIDKGDPKRNLRPLAERYRNVVTRAQQKQDYTLAEARAEVQGAARVLLNRLAERIRFLDPDELDANQVARHLKDLQVIIERTLGVADASVEVKAESRFTRWSLQELMEYAVTGTAPEHDASVATTSAASYKANEG